MAAVGALRLEALEFQVFVNEILAPVGAWVSVLGEDHLPLDPPIHYGTPRAAVLEAHAGPSGVYYDVLFGALAPASGEPGASLLAQVADPFEQVRPGQWVAELLGPDGEPQDEPRFLLINTNLTPDDIRRIFRGPGST